MLRSGGRLDPRPHHRSRPQRDDQSQSKEHQSQHGVEGCQEWSNIADGRKDFCLDQIDSELEPDETFLRRGDSSQVCQNDEEKRQNSKGVTNVAMRAPVRLPREEAETHQENLDQNGYWE
jgi:hypothetical protein